MMAAVFTVSCLKWFLGFSELKKKRKCWGFVLLSAYRLGGFSLSLSLSASLWALREQNTDNTASPSLMRLNVEKGEVLVIDRLLLVRWTWKTEPFVLGPVSLISTKPGNHSYKIHVVLFKSRFFLVGKTTSTLNFQPITSIHFPITSIWNMQQAKLAMFLTKRKPIKRI